MARNWFGFVLLALMVSHIGGVHDAGAQELQTERQQQLDRCVPWITASLGLAGSAWFYATAGWGAAGSDALFTADAADWEKVVIAVPSTAAFVATSYCMSRWFVRAVLGASTSWWSSVLWGAGAGAVTGAAIVTSGWLITLAMGDPMGVIDTGRVGAAGYLAVLGMSIVSGSLWGGLFGVVPGAVIGPGMYLYARR
jgi:hypothetical protein